MEYSPPASLGRDKTVALAMRDSVSSSFSARPSSRTRKICEVLARARALRRASRSLAGGARRAVPVGGERRGKLRLAFQDHAVVQHLQAIGGQRRAGGGDVHDRFGGAGGGRAFGGAGAFHDAVIGDAGTGRRSCASAGHIWSRRAGGGDGAARRRRRHRPDRPWSRRRSSLAAPPPRHRRSRSPAA